MCLKREVNKLFHLLELFLVSLDLTFLPLQSLRRVNFEEGVKLSGGGKSIVPSLCCYCAQLSGSWLDRRASGRPNLLTTTAL